MDTIDKWLKSLRLHKYTHLFRSLTYHEMLNLDEKYLIDHNVTKGARNKMLVSVKKLNLRQDRLINMMDDINQDNISMKEALTVLKDMLVTPIPSPLEATNNSTSSRLSVSSESSSSVSHLDPYDLTYLYIETLDKLAARLIESAGMEDSACHGIMAAILDECIKHNSFTKEQKAKVASYKQHFFKEQRAKVASFKQHFIREQKVKAGSFEHHQLRQRPHSYNHNHYLQQQHQNQQPLLQQQQQQHHLYHNHQLQQHQNQQLQLHQTTYREYSLLRPAITFELPCLRALVEKNRERQDRG